jgi:hypothetical protein
VSIAERPPLPVSDKGLPRVALPRLVVVIACDDEALEYLPSEWRKLLDAGHHILVLVVDVDDCIELEFGVSLSAHVGNVEQTISVFFHRRLCRSSCSCLD